MQNLMSHCELLRAALYFAFQVSCADPDRITGCSFFFCFVFFFSRGSQINKSCGGLHLRPLERECVLLGECDASKHLDSVFLETL